MKKNSSPAIGGITPFFLVKFIAYINYDKNFFRDVKGFAEKMTILLILFMFDIISPPRTWKRSMCFNEVIFSGGR